MGKVLLEPHTLEVNAPRELLYQMVSSFGKGDLPGSTTSAKVICREESKVVAEFYTKTRFRTVKTVEEVVFYPPEKMTFHWLKGPIKYVYEEFIFKERDGKTDFQHWGEFDLKIPVLGWLISRLYVKPRFEKVVREHMEEIKQAAEARAARSHVFRKKE